MRGIECELKNEGTKLHERSMKNVNDHTFRAPFSQNFLFQLDDSPRFCFAVHYAIVSQKWAHPLVLAQFSFSTEWLLLSMTTHSATYPSYYIVSKVVFTQEAWLYRDAAALCFPHCEMLHLLAWFQLLFLCLCLLSLVYKRNKMVILKSCLGLHYFTAIYIYDV